MRQLTYGIPTAADEVGLRKLAKQLRAGKLQVKFFGRYPLHANFILPIETIKSIQSSAMSAAAI